MRVAVADDCCRFSGDGAVQAGLYQQLRRLDPYQ